MRLRDKHRYVASLKQSTRVWGVRVDLVRALEFATPNVACSFVSSAIFLSKHNVACD